jgi:hypothetical protein
VSEFFDQPLAVFSSLTPRWPLALLGLRCIEGNVFVAASIRIACVADESALPQA